MLELEVQVATGEAPVPAGSDIEGWVRAALAAAGHRGGVSLTVRLVGEAEGGALNQEWRGKAGATNVLAFPGPPPGALPPELPAELGDVVVCLPVVHREAAAQGRNPRDHLAHLVVHGVLHLKGHTHEGTDDTRLMEDLESRVLGGLGLPDPHGQGAAAGTA